MLPCLAAAAHAEAPDAAVANIPTNPTDDAFGALLAMPGAQPKDGGWIIPTEAAKDEDDLIDWLKESKKDGANFNAMRHGGTLLAHAIRAGKDRTAIWLLANGADPHKVVFDVKVDAYTLALRYQRADVVSVLERQYGFKPVARVANVVAPKATQPEAPTAPRTKEQQSIDLLHRLTGRGSQPDVEARQAWRRHAATLTDDEFRALFKDGRNLDELVVITRQTDGGLDDALGRLPLDEVRRNARLIAGRLAEWSFVTYGEHQKIDYTGASRSWPALWKRIDQPLQYDQWPDLPARIPADLWPGLFASGYAVHDANSTGCVLAAVDLPSFKALWPDFQRQFTDARAEAAGLVLAGYRIDKERSPCYYGSTQSDTAAKLAFLRANGVTAPVYGLRSAREDKPRDPSLAAMLAAFSPKQPAKPALVHVAPDCSLALDDRWWEALVKARSVGWGIPPTAVEVVAVPGIADCGLLLTGDQYADDPRFSDSFEDGPYLDPRPPRCADAPDDGEIRIMTSDGVRKLKLGVETRGMLTRLRQVRDVRTGKRYLLDSGEQGPLCNRTDELPTAHEWQTGKDGPTLAHSRDDALVTRLLRQECREAEDGQGVSCPSVDEPVDADARRTPLLGRLRAGDQVDLHELLDILGTDRRAAYRAALARHDHVELGRLLAAGVPAWWTADEIEALAKSDLPLEERRRRIALSFANADQLEAALHAGPYDVPDSLTSWLPRQDWRPILRIVEKHPNVWFDLAQRIRASVGKELACEFDHAEGFVCGGGVNTY